MATHIYLSTNLKRLRAHQGWTQQQVADAIAVGRSRYNGWESGDAEPGLVYLIELKALFKVSLAWLVTRDLSGLKDEELTQLIANRTTFQTLNP